MRNIPQLLYNYSIKVLCIRVKASLDVAFFLPPQLHLDFAFTSLNALMARVSAQTICSRASICPPAAKRKLSKYQAHYEMWEHRGLVLQVVRVETLENELLAASLKGFLGGKKHN